MLDGDLCTSNAFVTTIASLEFYRKILNSKSSLQSSAFPKHYNKRAFRGSCHQVFTVSSMVVLVESCMD